ncbi:nucleoporin nup189 [Plectosphaerella plurivora]|uniref:Nucleoporin nup189 n=1 Tax=Plectosphaerella plurivora TaxID=936078 RepID=A0A9P8V5N3_9PEZI|nr:nucleoporin nup189 [Plectosphaerella plurivora]
MSFGGTGGFGGFGQANNQTSGFGGFGSNNNNTTAGFGNNTTATGGFGSTSNTTPASGSGGMFGGGGFGANTATGGFGSNTANNTAFGAAKPTTFGGGTATTGGGLFGSNNQSSTTGTTGFGGFGAAATTNNSSGFGGSGGLFGNKTFGQSTAAPASSSLFGSGNTNTGSTGFGGGFGAANNPGLGGNVGEPPGTNTTQFQAHTEKEVGGTGNLTNSFQNILFQDAYKKWSAEELRLTDYNQGRRYGNASGTGAFGVSSFGNTGFGSGTQQQSTFGGNTSNTTGGLFGGNSTNTSTTFGTGTTGGGGFGAANTGGGLFGNQAKPATGGLFGNTATTTQPAQTGGLFGGTSSGTGFGGSGTTAGGFGSNTNTSGGLFGGAQNKTGGFSFGTSSNTPATGFGAANTGGSFGANTGNAAPAAGGGGLFGNTGQGATGGLFGGTGQQQQPSQQGSTAGGFGSTSFGAQSQPAGNSLFGGAQQKPAGGLFGNTSSGTLFGNANAGAGTSTPFGANNTNSTGGGGLFGQKPATGGTGLFGGAGATNQAAGTSNPGTGLFGGLGAGAQNTQPAQGGLFQSAGQAQAKPGLFGTSQTSGGGLFGSQTAQQPGSLFGNTSGQQQAQNPSLLGGSLLGSSQMAGNPQQSLTASINDLSAYGNPSLFSNLGGTDVPNPGPLATPLSSKTKSRRGSILPMYKLNPASASRFVTPQKRGFGFSYSTYGTPGTPSSTASTPGSMGRSMLGSSLNRGLSKSVSSSSLRKTFSAEDSILAPGAFSTSSGSRYYGNTGSVRKLVINKEMRSDLFSTPTKERASIEPASATRKLSKRVSFDTSTVEPAPVAASSNASIIADAPALDPQETVSSNVKLISNGSSDAAAVVTGQELAIVHEEDLAQTPRASEALDKAPGEYWMSPTPNAISAMNRIQRQSVENFTVGRDNVGYVRFRVPVDLTSIDLDDIYGVIVVLETRSATVYPNTAKKPPVGKGLNVPAAICLEQSWPRGRDKRPTGDSRRLAKHVERLKRIPDTTFIDYSQDSGIWKFTVEHFTTYGLDYDDESELEPPSGGLADASTASPALSRGEDSGERQEENDTFEFRRKRRALPGAFDGGEGNNMGDDDAQLFRGETSVAARFAGPISKSLVLSSDGDPTAGNDGPNQSESIDILSGQSQEKQAAFAVTDAPESPTAETPGGILRARMRAIKGSATPIRIQVADGDEWMDMLQKSVSPQKRDRVLLKSTLDMPPFGDSLLRGTASASHMQEPRGFATSIDLMHSLFEKKHAPSTRPTGGFVQWPYDRQEKTFGKPTLDREDSAFHSSLKPTWGPDGTLVLPFSQAIAPGPALVQPKPSILHTRSRGTGADTGVTFLKFSNESAASAIKNHMLLTHVHSQNGVPTAELQFDQLADLFHNRELSNPAHAQEKLVWDLASILFDASDRPSSDQETSRRRELSKFWTAMVDAGTARSVALAKSYEGKALSSLAGNRIHEACKFLVEGRDFRLATLVSLIGASEASRNDISVQLEQWNDNDVLSDFSDAVRALYAILAGNVCICQGKKGVPIADRLESFVISRRFGFDWKQSFGLRLWYAVPESRGLDSVISSFDVDIKQDLEDAPRAWFLEQGIDALWQDPAQELRHDLLWGLLRLYARIDDDLESVLRPENSQLSPLDSRLSWQLGRALSATGKCSFGDDADVKADAATISFADQLVNEGSWLEATFVLLHLTSPSARTKAIKEHLCRHAGDLGSESGTNFNTLTQTWKIPAEWLWEAKALYMRSAARNPTAEVHCLLRAGSFVTAHDTLVSQVAPAAIISRDYEALSSLLAHFEGHEGLIPSWQVGGQIFCSFLALYRHQQHHEQVPEATLATLLTGLPAMQDAVHGADMASIAAVCEMSNIVAKAIATSQKGHRASPILELPLAENAHLKHAVHLGLSHYQGIMAGSR